MLIAYKINYCTEVTIEPPLQPITGELLEFASSYVDDGACVDISARGLYGGRLERTERLCYPQTSGRTTG